MEFRVFFLRSCACLSALGLNLCLPGAAYAAPKLDHLEPLGAQHGTQVTVQIHGSDLADVTGIWFSDPAIQAVLQPGGKPDVQMFQVTVPSSVPAGLYEDRVIGKSGISEAR